MIFVSGIELWMISLLLFGIGIGGSWFIDPPMMGDVLDPDDSAALEDEVRSKVGQLFYVGPYTDAAAAKADILLPACAWSEEDGSMVNFEGRAQQLHRCHLPRGESRPGWRIAADLEEIIGLESGGWSSAGEVLQALAKTVKEFEGSNGE